MPMGIPRRLSSRLLGSANQASILWVQRVLSSVLIPCCPNPTPTFVPLGDIVRGGLAAVENLRLLVIYFKVSLCVPGKVLLPEVQLL